MKHYKFNMLHKFFHIADNSTDHKNDLCHKVRPMIKLCNENWKKYFNPGKHLCLDECMIKYKGRIKFRQYCGKKPVKFGIKGFILCDSLTGYCQSIDIYTGSNTFSKISNFSKTESLVIKIIEPYLNNFRILYIDSFYTTIPLAKFLLKKFTGCIGTLRSNRLHGKEKEVFQDPSKNNFYNYIDKNNFDIAITRYNDKKIINLLSTVSLSEKQYTTKGKMIPSIVTQYNKYAKACDLCNQMVTHYRIPHGSKKWWRPVFFHLLYSSIHNSFILFKKYDRSNMSYKEFYKQIIIYLLGEKSLNKRKNKIHELDYIDRAKKSNRRLNCRLCNRLTMWKCNLCSTESNTISLCLPDCYNIYHSEHEK